MDSLISALQLNPRERKPRSRGLTDIRGPYYSVVGTRYLADVLDSMGTYIDGLKFAGGSFCLMPDDHVRALIELCHSHQVRVSTGGFLERALPLGAPAVERCLDVCRSVGFDTVEITAGFVSVAAADLLALARRALDRGFNVIPELSVQFGAGGNSSIDQLEAEPPRDVDHAIRIGERFLELGVPILLVESEGLTENVRTPRTTIIERLVAGLGLHRLMFEAADPPVFTWFVKTYGPDVNLFVDHSQIVQLEALRAGLWGTTDVWGRITTFKPEAAPSRS